MAATGTVNMALATSFRFGHRLDILILKDEL